mgnify:CR=1 FL=1
MPAPMPMALMEKRSGRAASVRRAAAAAAPVGVDELAFHAHRGKRQSGSFGDERRGRGGHGDEAVLAAHRAVPAGQIGHDNAVGRQVVGRHGDGNNVGDGIHGTHLVEVNFPNRYAMSPRLGVGHEAERAVRDGLGAVGHGGTVDDLRYFRRAAVVVATGGTVTMVVIVGATMVAIVVMAVLACAPLPVQVGHIMVVVLVAASRTTLKSQTSKPDFFTRDISTAKPSTGRLSSARRTASSLAPASSRAAAHMSPLIPEVHSK